MKALTTWGRRLLSFAVVLSPALALQAEDLVVNGVEKRNGLAFSDGKIRIQKTSMVMVVR